MSRQKLYVSDTVIVTMYFTCSCLMNNSPVPPHPVNHTSLRGLKARGNPFLIVWAYCNAHLRTTNSRPYFFLKTVHSWIALMVTPESAHSRKRSFSSVMIAATQEITPTSAIANKHHFFIQLHPFSRNGTNSKFVSLYFSAASITFSEQTTKPGRLLILQRSF